MRITFLSFLFCVFTMSVFGQVKARFNFLADGSRGEKAIEISWDDSEAQTWREKNEGRLEIMALKADLHSQQIPKSQTDITIFRFSSSQEIQVEFLMNFELVSPGESIEFINETNGKLISAYQSVEKGKILFAPFDPETTYMIWRGTRAGEFKSIFTINTIYVHEKNPDRGGPTIGFGTALSCHPNAACKEDSMMQLISNSAVRMRMVMEEGIGWCTGAFINNTRNDKSPFILSAHHCTYAYTPQFDLWRFDLEYNSITCENPASEPIMFSMFGCEKKAGGQASDFLLLLLNEPVPPNHQITFAGWNRNPTSTPDTTYLIHHPNADIRKLSTCINKAVIHPNQIGWSEGYNTPAEHHFRFKFTEGGHQPGSSGGPVFDQNFYIVGQLHGGTMGCEILNNAYTGRMAKSWELGSTPAERLKDWLDPDTTGVMQWPATLNVASNDIVDLRGTITDPKGRPVKNVTVMIAGSVQDTIVTNAEGAFIITGINRNGTYHITPMKNDNQLNGVSALDLLGIQKHLLGKDTFDFAWQHVAADATNNLQTSIGDVLVLLRLLLGKISFLPSSPAWRFEPAVIDLDSIPVGGNNDVLFQAIKIGDLNGNADPGQ